MTNLESQVLQELRQLPPEKQDEVLDFVQFLRHKSQALPKKSVKGLWADLNIQLTEKDIAEARAEMWGNLGEEVI
ncbi:MAG: DUF2281 domain-containing protein [Synechocystis sp.]|nr:DUF2281 domain-containing protein [Synechocystis sp.]